MAKRKRQNYIYTEQENHDFPLKLHKSSNLDNITRLDNFNLKKIEPKTINQKIVFDSYEKGKNLLLHGSAGTGKTFISIYLSLEQIIDKKDFKKIAIIRSVVPTRDVGFLPGDLEKKIEVYELPYKQIINDLFHRGDAYEIMKKKKKLDFLSTSFIRGVTFEDAILIVDEIQNMNFGELDTIMTRMGENCRIIFCGDFRQSDLKKSEERQGIHNFMEILSGMKRFQYVQFEQNDIVRSPIVKDYIINNENLNIF